MESQHLTGGLVEEHEEHGSIWPFVVAVAAGIGLAGLVIHIYVSLFALGLIFVGAAGWLHEDRTKRIGVFHGKFEGLLFNDVSNRKLGLWIFLASEIFFFTALIGTSLALRVQTEGLAADGLGAPWPIPGQVLNIPLTAVNTFVLLASSFTMVESLHFAQRGDQARMKMFLVATFLLGVTFVSIQLVEYTQLFFVEGMRPWGNPHDILEVTAPWRIYGSTFYVQTGFHGAHVTGGVIALAFLVQKAFRGGYDSKNHEAIELVGLYWHFVDVVWIFLFTIVYLT